jgi:hypothetical protein
MEPQAHPQSVMAGAIQTIPVSLLDSQHSPLLDGRGKPEAPREVHFVHEADGFWRSSAIVAVRYAIGGGKTYARALEVPDREFMALIGAGHKAILLGPGQLCRGDASRSGRFRNLEPEIVDWARRRDLGHSGIEVTGDPLNWDPDFVLLGQRRRLEQQRSEEPVSELSALGDETASWAGPTGADLGATPGSDMLSILGLGPPQVGAPDIDPSTGVGDFDELLPVGPDATDPYHRAEFLYREFRRSLLAEGFSSEDIDEIVTHDRNSSAMSFAPRRRSTTMYKLEGDGDNDDHIDSAYEIEVAGGSRVAYHPWEQERWSEAEIGTGILLDGYVSLEVRREGSSEPSETLRAYRLEILQDEVRAFLPDRLRHIGTANGTRVSIKPISDQA